LKIAIKPTLKIQNLGKISLVKITSMHYSRQSIYLVQSG
jgi:hypothetical protein